MLETSAPYRLGGWSPRGKPEPPSEGSSHARVIGLIFKRPPTSKTLKPPLWAIGPSGGNWGGVLLASLGLVESLSLSSPFEFFFIFVIK